MLSWYVGKTAQMKEMAENVAKCAVNMRIRDRKNNNMRIRDRKSDKNKQKGKECCRRRNKSEDIAINLGRYN